MEQLRVAPEIRRYTRIPFPAYRYLPFQPGLPHPRTDPGGHSFGKEDDYLSDFTSADWPKCRPYLYGIDLFNYRYWWEAHESWESVWLAAGRGTQTGVFVQGLIQAAAAQLKRYLHEEQGARLLTDSAVAKLSLEKGVFLGIEVAPFIAALEQCLRENRNEYPLIRLVDWKTETGDQD